MAINTIRFWCYKILPLVYDDSLSYYELLCKMTAKVNEVITAMNDSSNNVFNIVEGILNEWKEDGTLANLISPHRHADYHNTIYVSVAGSDDNDGTTPETAVRTLDRAFDLMAYFGAGAYIRMITSGEYTLNYATMHAMSLHLMYDADNITVYWGESGNSWSKRFYASYLHIGGKANGNSVFYSRGSGSCGVEPGKIFARDVIFTGDAGTVYGVYGGSAQLATCTFKIPFRFGGSNAIIDTCVLDPDIAKITASYPTLLQFYNGSTVTFVGENVLVGKSDSGALNNYINANFVTAFIRSNLTYQNLPNDVYAINATHTDFFGWWNRLDAALNNNSILNSCTVNGKYSDGDDVKAQPPVVMGREGGHSTPAGEYVDVPISYGYTFSSPPLVFITTYSASGDPDYGDIAVQVINGSRTTTGCTVRIINGSDSTRSPGFAWIAMHE